MTTAANTCRLLTPPGRGAIGVIRVVGPQALAALEVFYQGRPAQRPPDPRHAQRLHFGEIVIQHQSIDDVIVSARFSASGAPEVDINTHGSVRVIERMLMALRDRGFEVQAAGSASLADWPAGTTVEAEAHAVLVRAQTRRAVRFLLRQRQDLTAYLQRLAGRAERDRSGVLADLSSLHDCADRARILVDGARLALLGPPNAGKSTLANRLMGADRAIVSETPGTTRDWIAEPAAICGVPVTVVDTPGISSTAESLEALAIQRATPHWRAADIRILVLDGSVGLPADLFQRIAPWLDPGRSLLAVNKSDLPRQWGDEAVPASWRRLIMRVSARHDDGLTELRQRLIGQLGVADGNEEGPHLFTARQRDCVAELLDQSPEPGRLAELIRGRLLGLK